MPSRVDQLRNAETASIAPSDSASQTGRSERSERTAVSTGSRASSGPADKVFLHLYPRAEVPTIPYKLRFAISPDEWDQRVQLLAEYTERSAKPLAEGIYFFIMCIAIPAAIGYPFYLQVLDLVTDQPNGTKRQPTPADEMDAIIIPTAMALFLFIFFLVPMLLRKFVIRRRLRRETRGWAAVDQQRFFNKKKGVDLQWKVQLPRIFGSACAVRIPVPPRMEEDNRSMTELTMHSRANSWEDVEALGGAGLARGDSIGRQTMFSV
ncbi:hypothetical protein M408DRAFT_330849 [Serendipita vermifera MAFF 305830]|uniref:Uncharacterized protein n=1 Tax=Serendipita vermifera MAFF 305830 TaxID=933852 RepID=A0A0C3B1L6_SERVB|nr:hypothetical protein M408DRAFT_330849 [Serendipita vermifera MAFF 305830]